MTPPASYRNLQTGSALQAATNRAKGHEQYAEQTGDEMIQVSAAEVVSVVLSAWRGSCLQLWHLVGHHRG
jgi:hypothetical protein